LLVDASNIVEFAGGVASKKIDAGSATSKLRAVNLVPMFQIIAFQQHKGTHQMSIKKKKDANLP